MAASVFVENSQIGSSFRPGRTRSSVMSIGPVAPAIVAMRSSSGASGSAREP